MPEIEDDIERVKALQTLCKMFDHIDITVWYAEGEYAPFRLKGTLNGVTQGMQTVRIEKLEEVVHSFFNNDPVRTIGDDLRDMIAKRDQT